MSQGEGKTGRASLVEGDEYLGTVARKREGCTRGREDVEGNTKETVCADGPTSQRGRPALGVEADGMGERVDASRDMGGGGGL